MIKIIESPRDAMQGVAEFIASDKKVAFLNKLLEIGFDTLDFGSFVSPKAIPQLKDTAKVVEQLDLSNTSTKLLAIIGNTRGALQASQFSQIKYLGYPYSISESFLKLNINSNFEKAYHQAAEIQNICLKNNKELVLYISNAFGNIYGDPWSPEIVHQHVKKLQKLGIKIIALSDTTGVGNDQSIFQSFRAVVKEFSEIEFGAHLHTNSENWNENVKAAYQAGCTRFDTAINGLGGCPMSGRTLVGNLPTTNLLHFLKEEKKNPSLDMNAFNEAILLEKETFPPHF